KIQRTRRALPLARRKPPPAPENPECAARYFPWKRSIHPACPSKSIQELRDAVPRRPVLLQCKSPAPARSLHRSSCPIRADQFSFPAPEYCSDRSKPRLRQPKLQLLPVGAPATRIVSS